MVGREYDGYSHRLGKSVTYSFGICGQPIRSKAKGTEDVDRVTCQMCRRKMDKYWGRERAQ